MVSSIASFSSCLDPVADCKGRDNIEHRVFLVTNELGQEETLDRLSMSPLNGEVMIGVSGFFILNAAAVRGSKLSATPGDIKYIVLIDRSSRVQDFWSRTKEIIISSSTRGEVIERIKVLLNDKKDYYYFSRRFPKESAGFMAAMMIEGLEKEIADGNSWLSSDDKFFKIQEIFKGDRFIFKQMDLFDTEAVAAMSTILKDRNLSVDSVYLSNVSEYTMGSDAVARAFSSSVDKIVSSNAITISATRIGVGENSRLRQVISGGQAVSIKELKTEPVVSSASECVDFQDPMEVSEKEEFPSSASEHVDAKTFPINPLRRGGVRSKRAQRAIISRPKDSVAVSDALSLTRKRVFRDSKDGTSSPPHKRRTIL